MKVSKHDIGGELISIISIRQYQSYSRNSPKMHYPEVASGRKTDASRMPDNSRRPCLPDRISVSQSRQDARCTNSRPPGRDKNGHKFGLPRPSPFWETGERGMPAQLSNIETSLESPRTFLVKLETSSCDDKSAV